MSQMNRQDQPQDVSALVEKTLETQREIDPATSRIPIPSQAYLQSLHEHQVAAAPQLALRVRELEDEIAARDAQIAAASQELSCLEVDFSEGLPELIQRPVEVVRSILARLREHLPSEGAPAPMQLEAVLELVDQWSAQTRNLPDPEGTRAAHLAQLRQALRHDVGTAGDMSSHLLRHTVAGHILAAQTLREAARDMLASDPGREREHLWLYQRALRLETQLGFRCD